MIPLPAFLNGNLLPFSAGILLGALAAWGPASCTGKSQANAMNAQKVIAASAKVEAAAARATKASALVDLMLVTKTTADAKELREIIVHEATTDNAGPGVDAVMRRVRERAAAR